MKKLLIIFLLLTALILPVSAADTALTVSSPTTAVGNEFLLRIQLPEAVETGSVALRLGYDSTALEFVDVYGGLGAATAEQSGDELMIRDSGEAAAFALRLHFKALKAGSYAVELREALVLDAAAGSIECRLQSGSVNILEQGDDASLYALSTVPGTLSPAFSPDITHYSLTVSNKTVGVQVTARPNGYYATAFVEGHWFLPEGHSTVSIDMTSGGGVSALYTIDVYKEEPFRPAVIPEATAEPVIEATAEPTAEPTPEPTPEPVAEAAPEPEIVIQDSEETLSQLSRLRIELETAQQDNAAMGKAVKTAVVACMVEFLLIILLAVYIWKNVWGNDPDEDEDEEDEEEP